MVCANARCVPTFIFTFVSILLDFRFIVWSNVYVGWGCFPARWSLSVKKIVTVVLLALAVANAAQQPTMVVEVPDTAELALIVNI